MNGTKSNDNNSEQDIFRSRFDYEDEIDEGISRNLRARLVNFLSDFGRDKSELNDTEYEQDLFKERIDFDNKSENKFDFGLPRIKKASSISKPKLELKSKVQNVGYKLKNIKYNIKIDVNQFKIFSSLFNKTSSKKELRKIVVKKQEKINPVRKKALRSYNKVGISVGIAILVLTSSIIYLMLNRPHINEVDFKDSAELETKPNNSDSIQVSASKLIEQTEAITEENIFLEEELINNDVTLKNIADNEVNEKNSINELSGISVKEENIDGQEEDANEKIGPIDKISELDNLLNLAANQFVAEKLTTPAGDNAFETYQSILNKNPNNKDALRGIKNIHQKYMQWANSFIEKKDTSRAKVYLEKALLVEPNNQDTIRVLEGLENATEMNNLLKLTNNAPVEVQLILNQANVKLLKIEEDISKNKRDYKTFQDAQQSYQKILKLYPNTDAAIAGLLMIKNHYLKWADLELQKRNKNISKFLLNQAKSINISEADLNKK